MKMIWVIIRPDQAGRVIDALDKVGISGMTCLRAGTGRFADPPVPDNAAFDTPREILMIAVPDSEVAKTVKTIRASTRISPGTTNSHGGRIFVTYIDESFTIRPSGPRENQETK